MREEDNRFKVDVPEGTKGRWKVERFTVDERDAALTVFRYRNRMVPAGTYTRLLCGGLDPMMSDTPAEIQDHLKFIWKASGRVLIHGLGLGMCLQAVARKEEVTHVTVIELDQDLIDLVGPHYLERFGDKIAIQQGDAFTWKPFRDERWEVVWHDIWPSLTETNLPEMHRLHRRFGRRCNWQGSWGRSICERHREERKQNRRRDAMFARAVAMARKRKRQ